MGLHQRLGAAGGLQAQELPRSVRVPRRGCGVLTVHGGERRARRGVGVHPGFTFHRLRRRRHRQHRGHEGARRVAGSLRVSPEPVLGLRGRRRHRVVVLFGVPDRDVRYQVRVRGLRVVPLAHRGCSAAGTGGAGG